ncbi:MAG: CPBP family intramembrane metalloprotease [Eubacteriales bacterium]|nr:CPBP family intramembrane metalloprotease [Eubacteriales bacterium]HCR41712.1 hypothetical protein [Lachnospiraceae bacterium]
MELVNISHRETELKEHHIKEAKKVFGYVVGCSVIMLALLFFITAVQDKLIGTVIDILSSIFGWLVSSLSSASFEQSYNQVFSVLNTETFILIINIIVSLITTVLPYFVFAKLMHIKPSSAFKLNTDVPRRFWLYIPFSIGAGYIVNFIVIIVFGDSFDVFRELPQEVYMPSSPSSIILYYVLAAFIPAIFEEWAFRGLVLRSLMPYGRSFALISSSVIFGLMHIDPPQVIFATVFGLLAGFIYIKTGSIWYGTLIHLVNNSLSLNVAFVSNFGGSISLGVFIIGLLAIILMITAVVGIAYFSSTGFFKNRVLYSVTPPSKPVISTRQYFGLSLASISTIIFICLYISLLIYTYFFDWFLKLWTTFFS